MAEKAWEQLTPEQSVFLDEAASRIVKTAASKNYNLEYGYKEGDVGAYTPEAVTDDEVQLSTELVKFVCFLRHHTDFFAGPELTNQFPKVGESDFDEVLGELVIVWTGE